MLALIILGSFLMALAIGANNSGNSFGAVVGCGILRMRTALILLVLMAIIGATLQGHLTGQTIGEGIISSTDLDDSSITISLFVASTILIIFSYLGLPISTTQAIIGSIIGTAPSLVHWNNVTQIFFFGFLTPLLAMFFSFISYKFIAKIFSNRFMLTERYLKYLIIFSGMFLAYSLGANDIGNAIGLIQSRSIFSQHLIGLIAGLALSLGVFTLGRKMILTLGSKITHLDYYMSFSSQLGAALAIYLMTLLKIPTSTSFAIIGGIIGVGFVKGVKSIDLQIVKKITLAWFMTPLITLTLSYLIVALLK